MLVENQKIKRKTHYVIRSVLSRHIRTLSTCFLVPRPAPGYAGGLAFVALRQASLRTSRSGGENTPHRPRSRRLTGRAAGSRPMPSFRAGRRAKKPWVDAKEGGKLISLPPQRFCCGGDSSSSIILHQLLSSVHSYCHHPQPPKEIQTINM